METATTPSLTSFGARLALVRWEHGFNQKEAAEACGIAPATWREWEMGGKEARDFIGTCRTISDRLGVDLHWLVFGPELPRLDSDQEPAGSWSYNVA
jgi:transcriptional regulator with XRE-family HTH domain